MLGVVFVVIILVLVSQGPIFNTLLLHAHLPGCAGEFQEVGPTLVRFDQTSNVPLVLLDAAHVGVKVIKQRELGRHVLDFDFVPPNVFLPQMHQNGLRWDVNTLHAAGRQAVVGHPPGVGSLVLGLDRRRRLDMHPVRDCVTDLVPTWHLLCFKMIINATK